MLKFLRKYSKWILVIGGSLLMIAFLLPATINDLGRRPLFSTVMWVDGERISGPAYAHALSEHEALDFLTFNTLRMVSNVEGTEHWLLLVHEAERGGYIAGKGEGVEFVPDLVRQMLFASGRAYSMTPEELQSTTDTFVKIIVENLNTVMTRYGLTEAQIHEALSKLHGVMRMQVAYQRSPRFSDRRLAHGLKRLSDSAGIDYLFIPPDEVMDEVSEPTEDDLAAHFARYRDVEPGSGELGIGYRQPDRVKLEWLTLERPVVAAAVRPDGVEVQKRFLKANPSGQAPEGMTLEQAKAPYEAEVRNELIDRVMRAADHAIRGEFQRAERRTQPDGQFRKLPPDWDQHRSDFVRIRELVVTRVKDQTGVDIPAPPVTRHTSSWLTARDVAALPGIGQSQLERGTRREQFSTIPFQVRELAGESDLFVQVGVPADPTTDRDGNMYYFIVTDARTASPPESIDEVRDLVAKDVKRLAAFERLRSRKDAYVQRALDEGLDAMVLAEGSSLGTVKKANVSVRSLSPMDPSVDDKAFREAVLAQAARFDPTTSLDDVPVSERLIAAELPRSGGLVIAKITRVSPVTVETWRRAQQQAAAELVREELGINAGFESPFSFERLKERLNVKYKRKASEDPADATS